MSTKFIATTAIAALFASTAFAQTSDDPAAPLPEASPGMDSESMTPNWDASIADTFFEDEATGLVRSDEEIRERWDALSLEEQAQIRNDCAEMTAAADATGTMGSGDTELESESAADVLGAEELETDTMAESTLDAGDESLESESAADVLGSEELETDTMAESTLDAGDESLGSESAADVLGSEEPETDTMAESTFDAGGESLESESAADVLGSQELETDGMASGTLDTDTTTGSTTPGEGDAMDMASFQQICSTVGSL